MSTEKELKAVHGFMGKRTWARPTMVTECATACRKDQGNTTPSHEFLDSAEVLHEKVQMLADLLKRSKFTVAYTGAGLSRASGIGDYATKAKDSIMSSTPKLRSNLDAQPTFSHHVITALERAGLIHGYVQQNHDGLPQKSGFPQAKLNEIHGAWYDPSNPVVQFSGSLRTDLFEWMIEMEKKTDLCLCLGTSLSGMNADRMVKTPAKRSLRNPPTALGSVIINLQMTPLDDICAVRIWAKLDDVFRMLADELKIDVSTRFQVAVPAVGEEVYRVPYNKDGEIDRSQLMELDLRVGAKIRVAPKEASNRHEEGEVVGRTEEGDWTVDLGRHRYRMGRWWIAAAINGEITRLPVVNTTPNFIPNPPTTSTSLPATSTPAAPSQKQHVPRTNVIHIVQSHNTSAEGHKWGLQCIAEGDETVEKVVYHLHPTFRKTNWEMNEAPFEIKLVGWGTFTVDIEIYIKETGAVIKCSHDLSFQGEGDSVKVTNVPF